MMRSDQGLRIQGSLHRVSDQSWILRHEAQCGAASIPVFHKAWVSQLHHLPAKGSMCGYHQIFDEIIGLLCCQHGFHACSWQPSVFREQSWTRRTFSDQRDFSYKSTNNCACNVASDPHRRTTVQTRQVLRWQSMQVVVSGLRWKSNDVDINDLSRKSRTPAIRILCLVW